MQTVDNKGDALGYTNVIIMLVNDRRVIYHASFVAHNFIIHDAVHTVFVIQDVYCLNMSHL